MPRSDFTRFWAALSVSLLGSEITTLALPLLAALTLRASALEMGVLAAAGQLPFLLFSLPAGAWVDRLPRRPVLIATDLASALLLLSVPLAVPFGGPTFPQLCVVAFGIGTMAVVSEVAHYAYVPTLVGREHLIECNSRLQVSYSATADADPGLAGALAGGALGGAVGLRPALVVCAVGALLSPLPALFSPLRRLREQPAPADQLASEPS
jgi:MFS family permease